jgi:tetratricopeptide (TPR) repeat protein
MTYSGNSSLSPDVQQRIRNTFEHTLGLAAKGSRQEALLGCDFVLRMDPQFEPARRLQQRLEASTGPFSEEDLRRIAEEPPPAAPAAPGPEVTEAFAISGPGGPGAPAPAWEELEGLAPELPEVPEPQPGAPGDLRHELESLLAERRFQELQSRARQEPAAVAGDRELQSLVALATERLEAGPYISKFLQSARDAQRAGNGAEAARLLEKAKVLDPTHPGIAELTATAAGAGGAGRPQGATAAAPAPSSLAPAPSSLAPAPSSLAPAPSSLAPAPSSLATAPSSLAPAPPPSSSAPAAPASAAAANAAAGGSAAAAPLGPRSPASTIAVPLLEPAGDGESESEQRIQQLLAEGQAALDGGDPQAAIDAWSRIFLIDIDHQEASRRIDHARRLKAERDRQVEEAFHDGVSHLEAGDADGARGSFQRVLELQPGHLPAREYLQQLDEGRLPAPAAGDRPAGPGKPATARQAATQAVPMAPIAATAATAAPVVPLPPDLVRAAGAPRPALERDLQEEILVPPEVGQPPARPPEAGRETRAPAAAAASGPARRMFLMVGSVVLLLVFAVGWFLYQKREQWFPNSRTAEQAPVLATNPIPRATRLHDLGKLPAALAQLRRVTPGDPHYKEAQGLIARWQAEQAQATQGGQQPPTPGLAPEAGGATAPGGAALPAAPGGPSGAPAGTPAAAGAAGAAGAITATAPDPARRQLLLDEARKAYGDGVYLLAAERYEAAGRLGKLDTADAGQLLAAKQRLVPLQRQVALFRGHDWQLALPDLWRLHEADPANHDVTHMIVDSYYNLGVRDLQHNDVAQAAKKFSEAKNLAPDDPGVKRQLLFAQTYLERAPDLLYRIYVKYLPIR